MPATRSSHRLCAGHGRGRGAWGRPHVPSRSRASRRRSRRGCGARDGARRKRASSASGSCPTTKRQVDACDRIVEKLGADIDDVLVLGIGGSSLGARAAVHALSHPLASVGLAPGRRMHFPDNSDPWLFKALLEKLDPKRTLVLVISKSGGTVETAAQMLCTFSTGSRSALGEGALKRHVVAITDPKKGSLRAFATRARARDAGDSRATSAAASACSRRPDCCHCASLGIDARAMLARRRSHGRALRERRAAARIPRACLAAAAHVQHMRLFDHRHPRADAVQRRTAPHRRVVRSAVGREPRQAHRPQRARGRDRPDAAAGGRRHRPARAGAALHRGSHATSW